MFVSLALITPILIQGCAGGGGTLAPIAGVTASAELEWDDLDAAVSYVASREELYPVESRTLRIRDAAGAEHAVRRYLLVDVRDRPVEIRFSADPGALSGLRGASASRSGVVVVRVGRFGDHQREEALVSALLKRLDALALVD